MTPDIDKVSALIAEVGAEVVVPKFRSLAAGDISHKSGPEDLVTVADVEAEHRLAAGLRGLISPGALVVGEEAAAADPAIADALRRPGPVWVIDPIDGTVNFAAGLPLFGIMVAYVVDGDSQIAWIHDPLRGTMVTAARGAGAFGDGRRLRVARPPTLAHMSGAFSVRLGDRKLAARVGERCDRMASLLLLRSAAQEYLAISEGRLHAALYHRAYPWDHAAGTLIVEEAGGLARRLDGSVYRAADPAWGSPLLIAPDETRWSWIVDAILRD